MDDCIERTATIRRTNYKYPTFTQSVFTAGDVEQFQMSRKRSSLVAGSIDLAINRFVDALIKVEWSKYRDLTSDAVTNTFNYVYYKFRDGIFVKIENGKIVTFLPFSNARYRNEFVRKLKTHPDYGSTVQSFVNHVNSISQKRVTTMLPLNEWVLNNGVVVKYEVDDNGDNNAYAALRDMYRYVAEHRDLPDAEFFVNARSFPLLKTNDTEPYNNVYDTDAKPLTSHNYTKYAPIFSTSVSVDYADLALPTIDDWARCLYQHTGESTTSSCRTYDVATTPWASKLDVAIFRGEIVGVGTTPSTNQRLRAIELGRTYPNELRVDVTGWNIKMQKRQHDPYLRTLEPTAQKVPTAQNRTETFKYVLCLEEYGASTELAYALSSGSVVLLARSRWTSWFHSTLVEYEHYVPVDENLSNLIEQIRWCRKHDVECETIARNANRFYNRYLIIDGLMDYVQCSLVKMTRTTGFYRSLPNLITWTIEYEANTNATNNNVDVRYVIATDGGKISEYEYALPNGSRCIGRLDGTRQVFKRTRATAFGLVRSLRALPSSSIDVMTVNGFSVVRKRYDYVDDNALRETLRRNKRVHETYIGVNVVNSMVAKVPNFAYTYGQLTSDNTTTDAPTTNDVYVEYVAGDTFESWLKSSDYSLTDHLFILIQLYLALQMAQEYYGFVHYDLYPDKVIVQRLKHAVEFDYLVANSVMRIKTLLIPIIIGYGKSRAVVYERERGLIDHGVSPLTLYRSNSTVDALTIFLSSLAAVESKLGPVDRDRMLSCVDGFGLNVADYKRYVYDRDLIYSIDNVMYSNVSPVDVVVSLVEEFGAPSELTVISDTIDYKLKMEMGNAIFTESQMARGNVQQSFLDLILHIDKSTYPIQINAVLGRVSSDMLTRRMKWIRNEISANGDDYVKHKWNVVEQKLANAMAVDRRYKTDEIKLNVPMRQEFFLDFDVSPDYVEAIVDDNELETVANNWSDIKITCLEASVFDQTIDFGEIVHLKGFRWLNAIANNNTLVKIREAFI